MGFGRPGSDRPISGIELRPGAFDMIFPIRRAGHRRAPLLRVAQMRSRPNRSHPPRRSPRGIGLIDAGSMISARISAPPPLQGDTGPEPLPSRDGASNRAGKVAEVPE